MKTEQIKLYRKFIDQAIEVYWALFNQKKILKFKIEEVKLLYTKANFQEKYDFFEEELAYNLTKYDNIIARNYINSQFSEFTSLPTYEYYNSKEIIAHDFEIELLLLLEKEILSYYEKIRNLTCDNFSNDTDFNLDLIRNKYTEIDSNELVISAKNEDEIESDLTIAKPAKDSRFDFTLLKNEIEELTDNIDKIKLIKRRKHELLIWEKQCDTMEYSSEIGRWDYTYSRIYYPDFRHLCDLEISQIEDEIKLEERRQKSISQQPVVQTVTLPRQKLQWTKSSKEFVQTFHKLIENKKISLNGNYDLEPIARVLLETFDIPKGKGSGFVNEESMLTYFRKEHSGDLY